MKSAMVSGGSTGGAGNRLGKDAAMLCPAPGKCFGDRGTSQGRLEQQLPADPCVPPSPPGQEKRRVVLVYYLSRKPIPAFDCPLGKEMFPPVKRPVLHPEQCAPAHLTVHNLSRRTL